MMIHLVTQSRYSVRPRYHGSAHITRTTSKYCYQYRIFEDSSQAGIRMAPSDAPLPRSEQPDASLLRSEQPDAPLLRSEQSDAPLLRSADVFALIADQLSSTDLLSCICTSKQMRQHCTEMLRTSPTLNLSGSSVEPKYLLRILQRTSASLEGLDITGCPNLTKASIVQAVVNRSSLKALMACNAGVGSWTLGSLSKLTANAGPGLLAGKIFVDFRMVVNQDLAPRTSLAKLLSIPALQVCRLVLVNARIRTTDAGVATVAVPATGNTAHGPAVDQISNAIDALRPYEAVADVFASRHSLRELDASSGALTSGGIERLIVPLLTTPRSTLQWLACSAIPRDAVESLIASVGVNTSLRTLKLGCNCLSVYAAKQLASAIEQHPALTCLTLEHNQILDEGSVALAATLSSNQLQVLSLEFTGAADDTCAALARAISVSKCIKEMSLCGNSVGPEGVRKLTRALEVRGHAASLRALNLSANHLFDTSCVLALARVLVSTALEELHLCGCHVSGHACGVLAASIPRSRLRRLDLSLNPFGDEGAWCLAWALPECASTLTVLNLSSCNVGDDGSDEIREALALVDEATESIRSQLYDAEHGRSDHPVGEAHVQSAIFEAANLAIDLRGNCISSAHALASDPRVKLAFQRS